MVDSDGVRDGNGLPPVGGGAITFPSTSPEMGDENSQSRIRTVDLAEMDDPHGASLSLKRELTTRITDFTDLTLIAPPRERA
jgi:hypothetical protein